MADLIDRKTLGVGEAKPELFQNRAFADGWNALLGMIRNSKRVDAVPVVRCKDCKHAISQGSFGPGTVLCRENDTIYPLNGFCSKGTKEGGEEDDD